MHFLFLYRSSLWSWTRLVYWGSYRKPIACDLNLSRQNSTSFGSMSNLGFIQALLSVVELLDLWLMSLLWFLWDARNHSALSSLMKEDLWFLGDARNYKALSSLMKEELTVFVRWKKKHCFLTCLQFVCLQHLGDNTMICCSLISNQPIC